MTSNEVGRGGSGGGWSRMEKNTSRLCGGGRVKE